MSEEIHNVCYSSHRLKSDVQTLSSVQSEGAYLRTPLYMSVHVCVDLCTRFSMPVHVCAVLRKHLYMPAHVCAVLRTPLYMSVLFSVHLFTCLC